MIRLVIPLLLLTLIFWAVIYAIPKGSKRRGMSVARQFVVALSLSVMVLLAMSAVFYFGELINAN